ncbi:MAG: bifunctional nuclease domain-containing protein [bacterium]
MSGLARLSELLLPGMVSWLFVLMWLLTAIPAWGDFQRVKVQAVVRDPRTAQPVVLLTDPSGRRTMPIWIGEAEAMALEAAMGGHVSKRPLTHDLLASVINRLEASLEEVRVTELKEEIYYALILLKGPKGLIQVDARPSDALVLAVKTMKPVSVERSLFETKSLSMTGSLIELYGLEVQELDQQLSLALGHKGKGVLVAHVFSETPAQRGGIQPGDILEKIEGRILESPEELEEALQSSQGKMRLELFRKGKRLELVIPPVPKR